MKLDKLFKINDEIKRFQSAIDDAISLTNSGCSQSVDYFLKYGISGTKESGAVKRRFVDFKYEVNKIIKNND